MCNWRYLRHMFNLVIVLIATFGFALVLIYFIAAHDRSMKKRNDLTTASQTGDQELPDFRLFVKFCTDLCEYLKLEIREITHPIDNEVVITAQNTNPITRVEYLVVGFLARSDQEIERVRITEVSEQIVSERLSKGILITTGLFPDAVKNLPELAPLEFIDGKKIAELKSKMVL